MKIILLKEEYVKKALRCIQNTILESNSRDYSEIIIKYLIKNHYNETWLLNKIKNQNFYILLKKGEVIGTGSLDGHEIKSMFIDPNYQKLGFGYDFMRFLESVARDEDLKYITLNSSITARDFYKNLGFFELKTNEGKIKGETVVTYFMKKEL